MMGKIGPESFNIYIDTATSCVRKEGKDFPKMGEVEVGLEHALELQESTGAARKYVDPVVINITIPLLNIPTVLLCLCLRNLFWIWIGPNCMVIAFLIPQKKFISRLIIPLCIITAPTHLVVMLLFL